MKSKSLQYLVGEVAKQNEEAFNELYRRYHKLVHYLAFQLTKSSADADDVLQETFIQVQSSIQSLRDPKQFKAWVARIAYSKSMKVFQKQRDRNFSDVQLQYLSNKLETRNEYLPEKMMHHESDLVALDLCIGNLKGAYREILLLYYFGQLNIREIAVTLAIPEGTVKSRLLYAKKYLRTEIDGYQERTGEIIDFKASSLEAVLTSAGAAMSVGCAPSLFLPFKQISIPPTTMLLVAKIVAITTIASGVVVGGYTVYEQTKEAQTSQPLIANEMDAQEPFPRSVFHEQEISTARQAYETLTMWAHCEVEMKEKTKEEFNEIYPVYQALESFGGTYQQLLHRNAWAEQFLKNSEI